MSKEYEAHLGVVLKRIENLELSKKRKDVELSILKNAMQDLLFEASYLQCLPFPSRPIKVLEKEPLKVVIRLMPGAASRISFKYLFHIFAYLPLNEILDLMRVNKQFFNMAVQYFKRIYDETGTKINVHITNSKQLWENRKKERDELNRLFYENRMELCLIRSFSNPPDCVKTLAYALLALLNVSDYKNWLSFMKITSFRDDFSKIFQEFNPLKLKASNIKIASDLMNTLDEDKVLSKNYYMSLIYRFIDHVIKYCDDMSNQGIATIDEIFNLFKMNEACQRIMEYPNKFTF